MINQTKKKIELVSHKNFMSGDSYDIKNPLTKLHLAAASCFFGEPKFYTEKSDEKKVISNSKIIKLSFSYMKYVRDTLEAIDPVEWRSQSSKEMMESTIDEALEFDAKKTLEIASTLRQEDHIRSTPQIILVRAANHKKVKGTGLVRKFAPSIIRRADEPAVQLAYHFATYGKTCPIPNSLKKAWRDYLQNCKEYQLAKYQMSNREVKTVDVVSLVHAKSEAVDRLCKGQLSNEDKTWEAILSKEGKSKQSWEKAIDVMGHMALLRNLRNFIDNNVEPSKFIPLLVESAEEGQQLPFRYYSAYQQIKDKAPPNVLDAVEECLNRSVGNLGRLHGKTMCLSDNSGSAQEAFTSSLGRMKVSTIGNLSGILAGMISDEGYLGVFGDKLDVLPIRKSSSVFDQVEKAEKSAQSIGMNTENGIWIFLQKALKNKEHWDQIFVFSDMQAGHGGLYGTNPTEYSNYCWQVTRNIDIPKLIKEYRKEVNSNVKVFLVQTAGFQDALIPEFYKNSYILGGWSESIIKFAVKMCSI